MLALLDLKLNHRGTHLQGPGYSITLRSVARRGRPQTVSPHGPCQLCSGGGW